MNLKVLVVDDSGLARRTMRQILESAGHQVAEATDGISALEQFYVEKPDVVMLDLVMKGMYGLDVLNKLRELDPAVKVIVVSADIQTSSQDMVRDAGGIAFVNKPFDRQDILTALDRTAGRTA
ncbi:MAG TPA: response regulator [Vicinamibacterales bacterium]|nr:response regulator [Vicinamibacterales bacterium]